MLLSTHRHRLAAPRRVAVPSAAKMLNLDGASPLSGASPFGQKSRFIPADHPSCKKTSPCCPHGGCSRASCTLRGSAQLGWGKAALVLGAGPVPGPGGSSRAANPWPLQGCAGAGTFCPCQRRDGHELRVSPSPRHGRSDRPPPHTTDPPPEDNSLERRPPFRRAGTEHPPETGRAGGEGAAPCNALLPLL